MKRNYKPLNTKSWYQEGDLREQAWNERVKPPRDPVKLANLDGRAPKNEATGFVLFHQSAMPCGRHASKIMQNVPAHYLLAVKRQYEADKTQLDNGHPLSWSAVYDYVIRHLEEIRERAAQ